MEPKILSLRPDDGSLSPRVVSSAPGGKGEGKESGEGSDGFWVIQITHKDGKKVELCSAVHGSNSLYLELFSTKEKAKQYWERARKDKVAMTNWKSTFEKASLHFLSQMLVDETVALMRKEGHKARFDVTQGEKGDSWKAQAHWEE